MRAGIQRSRSAQCYTDCAKRCTKYLNVCLGYCAFTDYACKDACQTQLDLRAADAVAVEPGEDGVADAGALPAGSRRGWRRARPFWRGPAFFAWTIPESRRRSASHLTTRPLPERSHGRTWGAPRFH